MVWGGVGFEMVPVLSWSPILRASGRCAITSSRRVSLWDPGSIQEWGHTGIRTHIDSRWDSSGNTSHHGAILARPVTVPGVGLTRLGAHT